MAFYNPNTYYPNNYYNPNYPGYVTQGQQTVQNGGFVTVQNEDEAKAYPVAHGASVTFRDENQPYIYTKTLGFGQFDTPTFEKYKLTKETAQDTRRAESAPPREKVEDFTNYVTKAEYRAICDEIDELKNAMEMLRKELGA